MKMNRLIKRKNLFALLFAVLLALPMCAILGRVLYTQWNKNAKDSYSATQVSYEHTNNFITGYRYYIDNTRQSISSNGYLNINLQVVNLKNNSIDVDTSQVDNIRIYFQTNNGTEIIALRDNTTLFDWYITRDHLQISFTYLSTAPFIGIYDYLDYEIFIQENNVNTLDNAFEYSVNQFIDDNNFGKLDFFQWFDNMFLDSNNSVNNMYVHFVNWYLNYALLISLAYVLFLVLMWFINYVRKLLEKGMDFGEGSY